ncbi:hypothetical protein ACTFIV_007853 [Dictyostelium citrinum]
MKQRGNHCHFNFFCKRNCHGKSSSYNRTFVSLVFILSSLGTQVERLLFVDFLGYCRYCHGVHLLPLNNYWSYWFVFQLLFHCTLGNYSLLNNSTKKVSNATKTQLQSISTTSMPIIFKYHCKGSTKSTNGGSPVKKDKQLSPQKPSTYEEIKAN